jgi:hypothetical protein
MAEAIREMTVRVSDNMAKRIDREAKRLRQSPAEVASRMLDRIAEVETLDAENEVLLSRMSILSTEELRNRRDAGLTESEQDRLADLLQLNREERLSAQDEAELEDFLDRVRDLSVERAAALLLLRKRSEAG